MRVHPARIDHQLSTATTDTVTLTRLFLPFDLDVTGHAVARKLSKKYRHSNRLHRLATKFGERCGLVGVEGTAHGLNEVVAAERFLEQTSHTCRLQRWT